MLRASVLFTALCLVAAALVARPASAPAAFTIQTQSNPSFSLTLDGTDQTATSTMVMRITQTDPGPNGNTGWNVTLTSTTFATAGGAKLPTDASTLTGGAIACAIGPCTYPNDTIVPPIPVPAGSPAPPAVKVANAERNTGKGVFDLTGTMQTVVPANVSAGTYTSTMTATLVRGP